MLLSVNEQLFHILLEDCPLPKWRPWLQISCRYVAEISSIEILAPNYVCLDTKIMILSELEAEILKNLSFWSAILENGCQGM